MGVWLPSESAKSLSWHPSADLLELCALNRLVAMTVIADLEEHLLVCQQCQEDLKKQDDFVLAVIAAMKPRTGNRTRAKYYYCLFRHLIAGQTFIGDVTDPCL